MTGYAQNPELRDVWSEMSENTIYEPLTTGNRYLDLFSDPIRFDEHLPKNVAIEISLHQLKLAFPFEIDGCESVINYICDNNSVYLALIYAITGAAEIFPQSRRILSLYQDPEIDDEYLLLNIGLNSYPEDLFDKIDLLYPKYSSYMDDIKSGWLTVTTLLLPI